jgi:hypothetical protein
MSTNCALLFADLLIHSYEADHAGLYKYKKKLAMSFNFTSRYINDVLSMKNYNVGGHVDRICPIGLEINI